jgi:hypothetical protein
MAMRTWADTTTGILLVLLGFLWVGAKVHFFARFWHYLGADDLRGYVVEHSVFWAGMALIGLGFLAIRAMDRRKGT